MFSFKYRDTHVVQSKRNVKGLSKDFLLIMMKTKYKYRLSGLMMKTAQIGEGEAKRKEQ